ncbi:RDD family protein [Solimonas soli]|uniref:RDD family protein n=1 Tax=Solimonas soli TaxID=413479 RepID=UPI0004BB0D50|nr:RDD family protein [Solimonas soli]
MDELSELNVAAAAARGAPAEPAVRYVGFWARVFASLIDSIVLLFVLVPGALVLQLAGIGVAEDDPYSQLIVHLMLGAVVLAFWITRMATPGKMIINAVIVDAGTFGTPSWKQYLARYLAYFLSTIPFCLGLIWVAFDARKQGWHDKIAGTVVIRRRD